MPSPAEDALPLNKLKQIAKGKASVEYYQWRASPEKPRPPTPDPWAPMSRRTWLRLLTLWRADLHRSPDTARVGVWVPDLTAHGDVEANPGPLWLSNSTLVRLFDPLFEPEMRWAHSGPSSPAGPFPALLPVLRCRACGTLNVATAPGVHRSHWAQCRAVQRLIQRLDAVHMRASAAELIKAATGLPADDTVDDILPDLLEREQSPAAWAHERQWVLREWEWFQSASQWTPDLLSHGDVEANPGPFRWRPDPEVGLLFAGLFFEETTEVLSGPASPMGAVWHVIPTLQCRACSTRMAAAAPGARRSHWQQCRKVQSLLSRLQRVGLLASAAAIISALTDAVSVYDDDLLWDLHHLEYVSRSTPAPPSAQPTPLQWEWLQSGHRATCLAP